MAGPKPPRRVGGGGVLAEGRWPDVARLRASGKTHGEIAKTLGYSAPVITRTLGLPQVQALVEEERRIRQRLGRLAAEEHTGRVVQRLLELVDSDDENVACRAVASFLDRFGFHAGIGVVAESQVQAEPGTPEEVAAILDRVPTPFLASALARKRGADDGEEE